MKKDVRDMISNLNTYEKQELIKVLTEEIFIDHNTMKSNLDNIDGYVFGMIHNAKNNSLNKLTLKQLGSIKKLSNLKERV